MKFKEQLIQTPFTHFHTLIWGNSGPKIMLLHGFPETPHIFSAIAEKLVERGFQVFAPFLPGYGPTSPIHDETSITHLDDLAKSLAALSDAISEGHILNGQGKKGSRQQKEKIILVGHDWGAVAAYVTAAYYPDGFSRMVTMAVPPLPIFLKSLLGHPRQLIRSNYMLFFQLRTNIPETLINLQSHHYLKKLCLKWSGSAKPSQAYFSKAAKPFESIGDFTHPLGYYRGLFPFLSGSFPKWRKSIELAFTKIEIPAHILVGELDGCIPAPIYKGFRSCFSGEVEFSVIKNSGHFLPIDAPEDVANIIINNTAIKET